MQASPLSLKIGPYELKPIPTGEFALDGGAMFGTVPRVLWQRSNPPDDKNRISMEARGLLLKSPERVVLIDTGNGGDFVPKYGEKMGSKFAQMYAVKEGGPSLLSSLKKAGVTPDDVTDVILTHLHFDHAGGATKAEGEKLVPYFPRAQYYIQKQNLETAQNPNIREKASYLKANWEPLIKAGVLKVLNGPGEILPHISVQLSHGHTKGQQIIQISDLEKTLVYCADLVPTSSHISLPWIMGYDLDPLLIIEEKRQLMEQAVQNNWYLFFEHDPYCNAAQVTFEKNKYRAKQRYNIC